MQLTIILLCHILLLGVGYAILRIKARRDYVQWRRLTALTVSLEILLFAGHANLMYLFLPSRWPDLPMFTGAFMQWAGLVLAIGGFGLTALAMVSLGLGRLFGQHARTLQDKGLYGISRNPQIVTFGFGLLGVAVIWPSWYAVIWLMTYAVLAHWMVATEEEYLLSIHGESYRAYCSKVPRYIRLP